MIEYKPGSENSAADSLSRMHEEAMLEEQSCLSTTMSSLSFAFMDILRRENQSLANLLELHKQVQEATEGNSKFTCWSGYLLYQGRYVLGKESSLKIMMLKEFHESTIGRHARVQRTYLHLSSNFFWEGMHKDVQDFVTNCYVCQTSKYSTERPYGLLQPTKILEQVWNDIPLDFIVGLPRSKGYTEILVVVDRYSKYAHFRPLSTSHTASQVADLFCSMVERLHGVPRSITSDRDPFFTSQFWKKVFELMGAKLRMSSTYHPQMNDQSEVLNRCLAQYLRAFTADKPSSWATFMCWAEYHYNTSNHYAIGTSPFQAVYGRAHPSIPAYTRGGTSIAVVEDLPYTR